MTISFLKKFNELHEWIEKHPHVIQLTNVSDSLFVKINGTLVKKQNNLLHISVQYLHNGLILPISQADFFVQELWMAKNVFGNTSIKKYIPKYIKPMRNRNIITRG